MSVCPRSKRKTAWAINTEVGRHNSPWQVMAGPRHALILRSKGQWSNTSPEPKVRVLIFAMGMGLDAQQRECACWYQWTDWRFLLVAQYFYHVATTAIKTGIRRRGSPSVCRHDCTFFSSYTNYDNKHRPVNTGIIVQNQVARFHGPPCSPQHRASHW